MKKLLAILMTLTILCTAALPAFAEGAAKDETVYVLAAPDGEARKILVSTWLTNPEGLAELPDAASLEALENLRGEGTFEGGLWQADGQDVYYQGEGDLPLPVQVSISYFLNGEAIAPSELAGASGHVRIRFDYTVEKTALLEVGETTEEATVPYALLTGALLSNDVFTNVQVVNGRLVNDGDRTLVLGLALPGLAKSLGLDDEQLSLPEYVEIEADASDFSLPLTVTLATSEVFARLNGEELNSAEDLPGALTELADGVAQLLDGSAQLYDGLSELNEGAEQLQQGASALSDGLTALTDNNTALVEGSTQVFEVLLSAANQQLAAAGVTDCELTIENYAEALGALIGSMSEEGVEQQVRAQVEAAVRAQEEQVRAAVTQQVRAEVQAQVEEALGQAAAGEEAQAAVLQQTDAQMASSEVLALIDQQTEAQLQSLIEESMAAKDVQQQIQQAVSQYQEACASLSALLQQLNSYNDLHSGLIAYTQGVSSAADGAQQLTDSLSSLQQGAAQLQEGALALSDGLKAFSAEGFEEAVGVNPETLLARARSLIRAAAEDQSYSGLAENTVGSVRYIWRTDAIE